MAPERFDGEDVHEGDVYALGVCAMVLLTGDPAFKLPRQPVRHEAKLSEATARLVEAGAIQAGTADLIRRMLSYDAVDRPNAREVEQATRALQRRAAGEPLRDWAEAHVPALISRRQPIRPDSDALLVERSGALNLHAADTGTASLRPPRRWALALLAVAASVLALGGMATAGLGWWWLSVRQPASSTEASQVGSAAPVSTAPASVAESAPPAAPDAEPPTAAPVVSNAGVRAPASPTAKERDAAMPRSQPITQEVAPEPPASTQSQWSATGATRVWLEAAGQRYSPGVVPPGSYTVVASFNDAAPSTSGRITLSAGQNVRLTCSSSFSRCTPN